MVQMGLGAVTLRRRLPGVLVAVVVALATAGCGSLAPGQAGTPGTVQPPAHLSVADFADVVLAATVDAGSVHTRRVETFHGERTEMTGDTRFGLPSLRGRFTVSRSPQGATATASTPRGELRLLGARAYVHMPGLVPRGKFVEVDSRAPTLNGFLCSCLFGHLEPTTTLQNMGQSLTEVAYLGRDRGAGPSLEHYRLEADTAMIPGAVDADHPPTTRTYQVWLDSRHRLRRLTYSTVDKRVDLTYSGWGERVHVQRPRGTQTLHPTQVPAAGSTEA